MRVFAVLEGDVRPVLHQRVDAFDAVAVLGRYRHVQLAVACRRDRTRKKTYCAAQSRAQLPRRTLNESGSRVAAILSRGKSPTCQPATLRRPIGQEE